MRDVPVRMRATALAGVQDSFEEIPAPGRIRRNRNGKARDRHAPTYVSGGLA